MEIFNLEFLEPIYFLLIFLVPVLIYFIYKKQKDSRKFLFFIDLKNTYKRNSLVFYLKIALLTLIIVFYAIIFANPHKIEIKTENAPSIVFALDVSYSMETADV
ncbi:MAG: hypothetical protein LBF15_05330 [Candidatus Peribacteria bacterium]|jgi:hypothetical protein|nr:hypothetical protein [Candidatus Peribacteria bacterium]